MFWQLCVHKTSEREQGPGQGTEPPHRKPASDKNQGVWVVSWRMLCSHHGYPTAHWEQWGEQGCREMRGDQTRDQTESGQRKISEKTKTQEENGRPGCVCRQEAT